MKRLSYRLGWLAGALLASAIAPPAVATVDKPPEPPRFQRPTQLRGRKPARRKQHR